MDGILGKALSTVLAVAMGMSSVPAGAAPEDRKAFVQATFENDIFFHSDRYYTGGFQVQWGEKGGAANGLSRPLERLLCPNACPDGRRVLYSQKVGQLIYTPEDISLAVPQPNDRPWGAFLYYGAESLFRSADPTVTRSIGYQVGMVGPIAQGEQVQNGLHHLFNSQQAQGWGHQLDDEPGLVVTYMIEKRLVRAQNHVADSAVWASANGGVGNVATFGALGAKMAFGRNLPLQINPSQIGPKSLPLMEQAQDEVSGSPRYGSCLGILSACYVFVGVDARLIAHNIFLDGNTFQGNNG
ncbi:MAG TPA: lipid A deacylase LpxR family protein, partial [Burkholderiales bacterium]|nr:lipid A deacylase LpxR family protein [Burkholderiales bacterium]